jgi:hypothetical protein
MIADTGSFIEGGDTASFNSGCGSRGVIIFLSPGVVAIVDRDWIDAAFRDQEGRRHGGSEDWQTDAAWGRDHEPVDVVAELPARPC